MNTNHDLHSVSDPDVVWYGGMGHRLLFEDEGISCFRCGMHAAGDAYQELIPDCDGPDAPERYWIAAISRNGGPANEDYLNGDVVSA